MPLTGAQKARDRAMAQVVAQARRDTGLPVVLLAGNGHARRDLGVPRYLPEWLPQVDVLAIGLLEDADGDEQRVAGRYDLVISTATQPRADPCVAFLESMKAGRVPAAR